MKKIAFILHGKIKHRHSLISRIENVFSGSFELSFSTTTYPKHSEELALTAVINGATHVICVGGDGSLNEVVNGVMSAKKNLAGMGVSYDSLRVGLLPSGTGNDFSKTMKVVNDIGRLRQLIEDDSCRSIDLGLAEFIDPKGQKASQYFINITDVGMGGVVVEKIAKSSKFLGANLTYQKSIIGTLLTYKNRPVKAVIDDKKYDVKVMNLVIANGKYFGSGLGIAPDADPADGQFSVVLIGEISMLDYLKNLGQVRKCEKIIHPELKYLTAKEISIEHVGEPLPIDMDGEFIGYSPMKISIVHNALKFIC